MLWNTDIIDTCIVFRTWHVTSNSYFVGSCISIVLLGILYEYLRVFQQKLDYQIASSLQTKGKGRSSSPGSSGRNSPVEESGLLTGRKILKTGTGTPVPTISRVLRALVYGVTVFLSFFLMLVFMTYNAYLIGAVVVGASLGHYIFGSTINVDAILANPSGSKGMACH